LVLAVPLVNLLLFSSSIRKDVLIRH
jgi:hypothetical protein